MYGLQLTSPPVGEPVSVPEAKTWLRIEPSHTDDDDLIAGLVLAARSHVEALSGRQLLTASWSLTLDCFPLSYAGGNVIPAIEWNRAATPGGWKGAARMFLEPRTIRMPRAPLQSVQSITYYDLYGVQQTLASTVYAVDAVGDPGRITLAPYQVWPATLVTPGAVQVQFTAGYGSSPANVPGEYLTAIKMLAAHWYERRGDDAGQLARPPAVDALLRATWHGEMEYGT